MMIKRTALVTGGNRGIGLEICRQLGQKGIRVILGARSAQDGERAAAELRDEGHDAIFHPLDVCDEASAKAVHRYVDGAFGGLDILVNNAGIYPDSGISIFDVSLELVRKTFDVNTFGPLLLCQTFVPGMRMRNYGRVVNVSSGYGSINDMGGYTGAYKMSKLALNGMTRIMAGEMRRYNIKINTMSPGWVRTDMGGSGAPRTPTQGADTAVWLATLPDDGPSGEFFYERKPISW